MVYVQGGLSGIRRGNRTFGGLRIRSQSYRYSVSRFIHWGGNGIRKGYIWKRVQVCSLWGNETFLHHSFSRLGSDRGVVWEWSGSEWSSNHWWFLIQKKFSKKLMIILDSFTLHTHFMKLYRLTWKIYSTEARWTKTSLNMSPYRLTYFFNIDGLLMKSN